MVAGGSNSAQLPNHHKLIDQVDRNLCVSFAERRDPFLETAGRMIKRRYVKLLLYMKTQAISHQAGVGGKISPGAETSLQTDTRYIANS